MSEMHWIDGNPSGGPCQACGQIEDLRFGCCFDCACAAEERAARRSVLEHLMRGLWDVARLRFTFSTKVSFMWAWERLTKTGDYAPGGEFDRQYFSPEPPDARVILSGQPAPPAPTRSSRS